MADDRQTPRRRRRPQAAPVSDEPVRIIVGTEEDTPDWMVSDTSGAASRRNKQKKAEPEAPRHTSRGAQETQAILQMKQTRDERAADAAKKPAAPRKAPARKKKASARPMSKKARERRARKLRRLTIGALCGVIAVVLLIVGIRSGARLVDIKQTLDRGDGVFYPNIYVNDIPLQGKTLDEAAALVTQQVQSLISSFKITLRTQDGRSWDITGDSLNMQYNVADQLDQLWAIGHTGSSSVRYEQVKALEEEPAMRYTTLSYDMSQVNQILNQIKAEVDQPAVSATRVQDDSKWPPFSYTDDIPGQTLDITGLNERICTMVNMLESGVVDLTPVPVQPSVTRAQLEAQIVKLSSFETTVGKTGDYVESRTENIRVGTERFNRLTVAPGKSVSFNKVALKRTAANGYQAALEIAYGNYVEGIGGGICQVSSTLYNALLMADMHIVERHHHSWPLGYVDIGRDATISTGGPDLRFENTSGAALFILSETDEKQKRITVKLYGRPLADGVSIELSSKKVKTLDDLGTEVEEDASLKPGEQQIVRKARQGSVAITYKTYYSAEGAKLGTQEVTRDTYRSIKGLIKIAPAAAATGAEGGE